MFTGIVEETGTVAELRKEGEGTILRIAADVVMEDLVPGASIAVDGACLTVVERDQGSFTVGLSPETLQRTNLGSRRPGDRVNLERAVRAGGRMGGHYVQGHVDGVGTIVSRVPIGDSLAMSFRAPPDLMPYIVEKGFIAVDGVSLTVTRVEEATFSVMLVAYTRQAVALGAKDVGDSVNLEVDVVAKYVERLLESRFVPRVAVQGQGR